MDKLIQGNYYQLRITFYDGMLDTSIQQHYATLNTPALINDVRWIVAYVRPVLVDSLAEEVSQEDIDRFTDVAIKHVLEYCNNRFLTVNRYQCLN